jgi:hypothetical protein
MAIGGTRRRFCGGCGVGIRPRAARALRSALGERSRRDEREDNTGGDQMPGHG